TATLASRRSYWEKQPEELPAERASARVLQTSLTYERLVAGVHRQLASTARVYEALGDRAGAIRLIEEVDRMIRESPDFKPDSTLTMSATGRLEYLRGNLAASEAAYVRQLELTPTGTTSDVNWDIGQVRY